MVKMLGWLCAVCLLGAFLAGCAAEQRSASSTSPSTGSAAPEWDARFIGGT